MDGGWCKGAPDEFERGIEIEYSHGEGRRRAFVDPGHLQLSSEEFAHVGGAHYISRAQVLRYRWWVPEFSSTLTVSALDLDPGARRLVAWIQERIDSGEIRIPDPPSADALCREYGLKPVPKPERPTEEP